MLYRELEIILDVKHPDQPRNNKLPSFKDGRAMGVGRCEAFEIASMDALAPTKERPGRETRLAGVSEFDDVPRRTGEKTSHNPFNSPARHTRTLSIRGLPLVTAADVDVGGWIRTFHNVVHLHLECI